MGGGVILLLVFALVGQAAAQTWTQLSPIGGPPGVRVLHTAVFNSTNNRMIVFGGMNGPGVITGHPLFNDVWVLTNADGLGGTPTWTQLFPTGGPPSARGYHSAVYDVVNNRMIVFAGDPNIGSCFGAVNDVWVLTNADGTGGTPNWSQLSPTGGPPNLRQGPTAVYDAAMNRMVVFGGRSNACSANSNAVWVLQNANGLGSPTWTQLFPTGGPPSARSEHIAVYDATNNRMIVFSGCVDGGPCPSDDVWVLQNANGLGSPTWTQLFPTGGPPPSRSMHTAVYDQATNRMTVFGGDRNVAGNLNDVWVLEVANGLGGTPNWTQLFPTGGPPRGRSSPTAVYNPATNRMVMFAGRSCSGGCSGAEFFALNDVWVLTDANGIPVGNVNLAPEAHAGGDQTVNEDAPVMLDGSASFDPDLDAITYSWVQTGGTLVTLTGPDTATPSFTAPLIPGGVGGFEILTFELTVSDGYLFDTDTVQVTVEQVNHAPVANAGADQTKDEGALVTLNGTASSDPDGDAITYSWVQTGGTLVTLTGADTATPSFTAPPVGPGGDTLVFKLSVSDGQLSNNPAAGEPDEWVSITVQNVNDPPICQLAQASPSRLWPPNHKLVSVGIVGVSDPNNDGVTITITGVTQDERVNGLGDGDTSPDAVIQGSTVLLRAERSGNSNGRVYRVGFTADDGQGGSCAGSVEVSVPKSMKPGSSAVDDGQLYNSTLP
ncbi:MAG: hypothetical protein A3F90_04875 [Deltaproteobacteria bacterium RIFCSPLOWO2_12_FULL_60_19]|nr:MAG: hypothetical protein A3F90_04875 [Deltaproteobacteria bacterium RIFCSPLOWO2_12_FULL_60_19]